MAQNETSSQSRPSKPSDLELLYKGKVRSVFKYDEKRLLIEASDRVSAFDVVFERPIPSKGAVLNMLAAYWFDRTRHIVPNHMETTRTKDILAAPDPEYVGRLALVKSADPIRFECVVRAHLDGSGWREYQESGQVIGHQVPAGLKRYDALPEPIFTPARKALTGHDENITVAQMIEEYGEEPTRKLEKLSLDLFKFAYDDLKSRGVIMLDTKFEFGVIDGEVVLIDEIFTPDSSRFRVAGEAGASEPLALDKQYLRDHLESIGFMGEGEAPELGDDVVNELRRRYERVFQLITGGELQDALAAKG